jgi:hypothetical protein
MEYRGEKQRTIRTTCRDCKERHPGCHAHCQKYQEALSEWMEFKTTTWHNKKLCREINAFEVESVRRNKHGKYGK